jgi:hypothetical protein
MQLRYTQMLAALRQGQRFLDANSTTLGDLNAGGARTAFDQVTAQLGTLAELQDTHRTRASGELTNEQRLARSLRRQHMRPIVKVARAKVPEAAQLAAVSLPPIRSNSTDLTVRARAMADSVEPHKQLLHDGGLPSDFIDRLKAAADTLDAAIRQKGTHQKGRIGATDGITQAVTEARRQVDVMDSLVRAQLGEQEPLVTEWRSVVQSIRAAVNRATSSAAASPTPVTPAPVAPAPVAPAPVAPAPATPAVTAPALVVEPSTLKAA